MHMGNILLDGAIVAAVGGLIGSFLTIERKRTVLRTISHALLQTLMGGVLAGAMAEYMLPLDKWFICALVGMLAGIAAGHIPDAIKAVAPEAFQKIIKTVLDKIGVK